MAETQIQHLNDTLQEKPKHDTSRDEFRWQTVLKQDIIDDIIMDNGFIPNHGEDDWIYFKKQGETYGLSVILIALNDVGETYNYRFQLPGSLFHD